MYSGGSANYVDPVTLKRCSSTIWGLNVHLQKAGESLGRDLSEVLNALDLSNDLVHSKYNRACYSEGLNVLHDRLVSILSVVSEGICRDPPPPTEDPDILIPRFPNEILVLIIKMSAIERHRFAFDNTKWVVRVLSLVSKWFWSTIRCTPYLWARIDNKYCLSDGFDKRILRSGSTYLTVDLSFPSTDVNMYAAFSRVLPYICRCQSFRANRLPISLGCDMTAVEYLEVLPFLLDSCNAIFAKWGFPQASSLAIIDGVPPPGILLNLTCFTYEQPKNSNFHYDTLQQLVSFLEPLKSLERLSLGIPFDTLRPFVSSSGNIPPVRLGSVESFTITNIGNCSTEPDPYCFTPEEVFEVLDVPCATDVRIQAIGMEDWIARFNLMEGRLAKVTHLSLVFNYNPDAASIASYLRIFPNIRTLELELLDAIRKMGGLDDPDLDLRNLTSLVVHHVYVPVDVDLMPRLEELSRKLKKSQLTGGNTRGVEVSLVGGKASSLLNCDNCSWVHQYGQDPEYSIKCGPKPVGSDEAASRSLLTPVFRMVPVP